jgi:hypothetical protein
MLQWLKICITDPTMWDYIFCEGLLSAPVRKNVLKTDAFFILVLCSTKTNICRASHYRVTVEEKKNKESPV